MSSRYFPAPVSSVGSSRRCTALPKIDPAAAMTNPFDDVTTNTGRTFSVPLLRTLRQTSTCALSETNGSARVVACVLGSNDETTDRLEMYLVSIREPPQVMTMSADRRSRE